MKYISINTIRIFLLLVISFSALANNVSNAEPIEKDKVDNTVTVEKKTDSTLLSNIPQAIISPAILRVTQGEKAIFLSLSKSKYDRSLSLEWNSKISKKSTGSSVAIDTSTLALGEHLIQLKITDDKGHSDHTSATLIIFKTLENKQYAEDSHYFEALDKEITARAAKEKFMQEQEDLKELIAQVDKNHIEENKTDNQEVKGREKNKEKEIAMDESNGGSYIKIFIPIFLLSILSILVFLYAKKLYLKYYYIDSSTIENNEIQATDKHTEPPSEAHLDIKFSFQIDRGSQKVMVNKEE